MNREVNPYFIPVSWQNADEPHKPNGGRPLLLLQSLSRGLPVLRCAVGMCCDHHWNSREPDDHSGLRLRPPSEDSLQCADRQPRCRWPPLLHHTAAYLCGLLPPPQMAQWWALVHRLRPAALPLQLCLHHHPLPGGSEQISPGCKADCVRSCLLRPRSNVPPGLGMGARPGQLRPALVCLRVRATGVHMQLPSYQGSALHHHPALCLLFCWSDLRWCILPTHLQTCPDCLAGSASLQAQPQVVQEETSFLSARDWWQWCRE